MTEIKEATPEQEWVMVPKEPTEAMHNAARDWSAAKYGKPIGLDASDGCYRAMLAARPVPSTEGWRPIASAPKDGTEILGRDRYGHIYECQWWSGERIAEDEGKGEPEDYQEGWYHDGDEVGPRYWMPLHALPSPPSEDPRS